jgi:hypothetical protein
LLTRNQISILIFFQLYTTVLFYLTGIQIPLKFSIAKELKPRGYRLFSLPSIVKCQEKILYSFLWALWFPSTNKTHRHDMTEILLKVTVNTIIPNPATSSYKLFFDCCSHLSTSIEYFSLSYHMCFRRCRY